MSRSPIAQSPTSPSSSFTATSPAKDVPFQQQPTYITLSRMLVRLSHNILLLPPSDTLTPYQEQIQRDLRNPLPYYRAKWLHNVEHARTLLLQLEHSAQSIKVQRAKRDVVHDLAAKRTTIKKLRARIEDIGREVEALGEDAWENTEPGETIDEFLGRPPKQGKENGSALNGDLNEGRPMSLEQDHDNAATILDGKPYSTTEGKDELMDLRRRRGKGKEADSTTSGFSSLPSTEKVLLADSRTHEDLTTSLVNMAAQLKQQSRNFQATLEMESKTVLGRLIEGLDKNVSGMDAASKRMGVLRRMSEGRGWFGRIMLYLWIFGLWIVAILLVFVGPKLRF